MSITDLSSKVFLSYFRGQVLPWELPPCKQTEFELSSLSELLISSCEGAGAKLSSRMWEWERKGNWGLVVMETWGGCLQRWIVFIFGMGDIHRGPWGLQCISPASEKSSKVLRIGLSSWSLKWASSLLSLLPINPRLGSWQPPTCSGRTQWPHIKFIAYNTAVGGDIKYFCGVFSLGFPVGAGSDTPILIHYPLQWGMQEERAGVLHTSAESQGEMLCQAPGKVQVTCAWCTLSLAFAP